MLLNADKRDAYQKVVDYLRTPGRPEADHGRDTTRRPVVPGVALDARFPSQVLVELPFPSKLDTIDALLRSTSTRSASRRPATFVLDLSGSMEGDRLIGAARARSRR